MEYIIILHMHGCLGSRVCPNDLVQRQSYIYTHLSIPGGVTHMSMYSTDYVLHVQLLLIVVQPSRRDPVGPCRGKCCVLLAVGNDSLYVYTVV